MWINTLAYFLNVLNSYTGLLHINGDVVEGNRAYHRNKTLHFENQTFISSEMAPLVGYL